MVNATSSPKKHPMIERKRLCLIIKRLLVVYFALIFPKNIDGKYKKIHLVYTKYVNSLTFTPESLQLLPVKIKKKKEVTGKYTIMEPSPIEIIEELIPMYVKSATYGKLIESVVSEQASRRTAMETATDNSQEIIEKLQILYNKARQAAITQEITEIVGGAMNK